MSRELFKVSRTAYWVHYGTAQARRVKQGTPGAIRIETKSKKWYARVDGRRVPLSENKEAARIKLGELTKRAALADVGAVDPFETHRKRPLGEHLQDYRRDLASRDNRARYVQDVCARLDKLLTGCGFQVIGDIAASRVMHWLADLRDKGEPRVKLPAGVAWFTLREAAAVLGVKPASVGTAVRRHRLAAQGKGRARRLARATVEALQDLAARGVSPTTSNQYLSHLKSFCRWLVKDRRTNLNPVLHLEAVNEDVDRRHDRRALDADELGRVLTAARASTGVFRGLRGIDRFHLYATACGTGFRAAALASLTPESFDLDNDGPTVTLAARFAKNRRTKVQPLPADVAALLRAYLRDKPAGIPVWNGTWASDRRGAEMLRRDLEAAGLPYTVPGPDGPLFADFHALRHSYLTLGGLAGIDLRTLQELAGHSNPSLTARYSHRKLYDLAGAVEKLPSILPAPSQNREPLAATGTEGSAGVSFC